MRSNYKRLGNYIREVNIRNKNLRAKTLLGINIDKYFMPSVANIVGTDLSAYKIVQPDHFACNRMHVGRDYRLPIALSRDTEDFIVSPAYDVFKVLDENILLPEYLMMWFSRKEFDRNAWFYTDADVRGGLPWKSFCDMQLPIPDIEKQKELVKEYHTIVSRIDLNNQFIQKLEETAQAIYKHWFIDFEFPDKSGNPYKENGGEMEFNQELQSEIPKGWNVGVLSDVAHIIMGQSPEGESYNNYNNGIIFYQGRSDFGFRYPEITTYTTSPTRKARKNDILISVRAPVGDLNIAIEDCCIGRGVAAIRSKNNFNSHLFYLMQNFKDQFDISNDEGTIFGSLNKDDLHNLRIVYNYSLVKNFDKLIKPLDDNIKNYSMQNKILIRVKEVLLSKLSTQ